MVDRPAEYLNLSEVLFLQPKNLSTLPADSPPPPPPRSPRRKQISASPVRDGSVRRHELVPHLQNSPYLRSLPSIQPPTHDEPRSARSRKTKQQSPEYFVPPPGPPSMQPVRRGVAPPLLYQERNKIFESTNKRFFKGLNHKYQRKAAMTPYGIDMEHYLECGLRRSAQNRMNEKYEDYVQTVTTNKIKTQARLHEVATDKRYTKDYQFNSKYPELRMIPVADRIARAEDSTIFI